MNRGDVAGAAEEWRRAAALRPEDPEVRGYLRRLGE
jgi:Flp pilus assembly protein TadD